MSPAMPLGTTRHHTGQQRSKGTGQGVENRDCGGHQGELQGVEKPPLCRPKSALCIRRNPSGEEVLSLRS
jgi:hypothetical protein